MSLGTILLILLVIFLLGGFSGLVGGYGYGFGHSGIGVIGVILIIVLVLVLTGVYFLPGQAILIVSALWATRSRWQDRDSDA